jgi:hypothetical protein
MKFYFRLKYFIAFLLLFLIEVYIALYVNDNFVRPYIGDLLVVILIYCFVQSFCKLPIIATAIVVLLFSFAIETLQYFNFVQVIGLQHSKLANVLIGNSFAWADIVAYTAGIIIVLFIEKMANRIYLLKLK